MTEQDKSKEIDAHSGVETTGHEWDGLKELNNPAPRWWLWIFYATIIWSVGYWIVYPAWPTLSGHTKGTFGWTQYEKLEAEQAEIAARQETHAAGFRGVSLDEIRADADLYAFALAGGRAMFKDNCATCHGTGGAGGKGYPNLNDDDWLWGGTVEEIYHTIRYGIRSGHDDAHISQMPAFGRDGILKRAEIEAVADYVLALSRGEANDAMPGAKPFADNCAACHGAQGEGMRELGAPRLADGIWLYGGKRADVFHSIYNARSGVMPYWQGRLDDATIKQLAIYVHSLGGGEENVIKGAGPADGSQSEGVNADATQPVSTAPVEPGQ